MAWRNRIDGAASSPTETVSTYVLARPKSDGCWRRRHTVMLATACPWRKKAQYAYCSPPPPGISSWTMTSPLPAIPAARRKTAASSALVSARHAFAPVA
ncbi:MAG TPA: hypothetical protein VMC83_22370 [Streptosporangiaceae bacterium]|nr:hypothetical protein [Streptosporangiaceae bacterium]